MTNAKYDYLIVGAGLFGAVFAYQAKQKGKKCLVIDKRNHIGGNVYSEKISDIHVHKYGAHIFHTDNKIVWDFINNFCTFNRYTNSPIAIYKDEVYNLPFNMNTFNKMWGVKTPQQAKQKIEQQIQACGIDEAENLEQQAIRLVGKDIYTKLIEGYTQKQWGKEPKDLPAFIIKRLPVRFTYDNNYFNDRYQGIPIGGYTQIFEKLLHDIEVKTNTDYFENQAYWDSFGKKVVYTGMIDAYFGYQYGALEYRSLKFENEVLDIDNFQGNAVVNYTQAEIPYTRIIEHKHFEPDSAYNKKTVITREYPCVLQKGDEPYYPVNDEKNNALNKKYQVLADKKQDVIFGGRLAQYRYYDMDDVIEQALCVAQDELG